jgi:hypothetical protein|tara:strand:- start:821 stop:1207 length:387 start_codon:yes stop_codon:yes gene_type:complete
MKWAVQKNLTNVYELKELTRILNVYNFNIEFFKIIPFSDELPTIIFNGYSFKLLDYLKNQYKPEIISIYSDARFGDYKNIFTVYFNYKNQSNPNYFYLKNNHRIFSKRKLDLHKIWDCGNYIYEWRKL